MLHIFDSLSSGATGRGGAKSVFLLMINLFLSVFFNLVTLLNLGEGKEVLK